MILQDQLFSATAMPDRDWWQALWPDPERIVRILGIQCGMEVVDLGCGYGYFTAAIARQVGPGHVIAIDIDPDMLEQARIECKAMTNCVWQLGDAMDLGRLVTDPVDFVLFANALHGVPDKTALAARIHGILRPGGHLAIVNWHPIAREQTVFLGKPRGPDTELRISPEQTCVAIEPAGFSLEAIVELPSYHYGAIFVRSEDCGQSQEVGRDL
ncbi:MAG: class I SAM-dependent methyltransferase [Acidiferrobacterales bacterium]